MNRRTRPTFRRATDESLAAIEVWLRREQDQTDGGFFCNWSIIQGCHTEGGLFVIDVEGDPVAFLANDGLTHIIAEVRPDRRGCGYGKMIADAMVAQSTRRGLSVIEIACSPEDSAPFWRRMGFTPVPSRRGHGGGIYAFLEISRPLTLGAGRRVPFAVRFFTEDEHHSRGDPFRVCQGEGELLSGRRLRLPERASCYDPEARGLWDCYVEIEVAGQSLIRDKTKRDEARALGMSRDAAGTPYIEVIRLPAGPDNEMRVEGA